MPKQIQAPIALTIAGSDSGGGAGIQADLKTFASLGLHGVSVITCLTAQNPKGVRGVERCSVGMLLSQLEAVFEELPPAAIKTGMLYSTPIIHTVAHFLARHPWGRHPAPQPDGAAAEPRAARPLVVDPVMISTSGTPLLKASAMHTLMAELLPLAGLVTPNVYEAEELVGEKLKSLEDLRRAARALQERFGCAALVKGGHLRGLKEAADVFFDGRQELLLSAPFVRRARTHGTGCVYSSAIAGGLARGLSLVQAVRQAKEYITQAIAQSQLAAGHSVLNSFWR